MNIHTITVQERAGRFITYWQAYAGSGLMEMTAHACSKWDAIGFLVEDILKFPEWTLANSVDVIEINNAGN